LPSAKGLGVGAFWTVVSLAALLIFGTGATMIVQSIIGGSAKSMTRQELISATASELGPSDPSVTAFGLFSHKTDAQKDAFAKEIVGKVVQWTLPAYDVSISSDELTVQTNVVDGRATAVCTVANPTATDEQNAAKLSRGDLVTCKGVVKGAGTLGTIEIDPAIIVW
jgi:hypothetical protein